MINFRYHIISIVAVFLALAVGVVMGSAVIDKAVVETLEDQQAAIDRRVDRVIIENDELRLALDELEGRSQQLAEEGTERLLAGSLADVPVLVLAVRGVEDEGHADVVTLLGTAGAEYRGTLWFTGRLALESAEDRRDLARALGRGEDLPPGVLREAALTSVTAELRAGVAGPGAPTGFDGGSPDGPSSGPSGLGVVAELREAGFIELDASEGSGEQVGDLITAGTRVVLVSGPTAVVDNGVWARPLASALVEPPAAADVLLLAVESFAAGDPRRAEFTEPLRTDDALSDRMSTVDNIDEFAGRLAAVLALQDLAADHTGHYGRDAPRLIPAPAE